jgi:hypothetical protein
VIHSSSVTGFSERETSHRRSAVGHVPGRTDFHGVPRFRVVPRDWQGRIAGCRHARARLGARSVTQSCTAARRCDRNCSTCSTSTARGRGPSSAWPAVLSRWQPSGSGSVGAIAFSRDQRIMVSATGGPPWEATSTLWEHHRPGPAVAAVGVRGREPRRDLAGRRHRGHQRGRRPGPGGPVERDPPAAPGPAGGAVRRLVRRAVGPGVLPRWPHPGRRLHQRAGPVGCGRPGSSALSDLTTIFRNVSDAQPVLAPGGRIVADGSLTGGEVHLWTLP